MNGNNMTPGYYVGWTHPYGVSQIVQGPKRHMHCVGRGGAQYKEAEFEIIYNEG
jgi:hypothetical protein